MWRNQWLSIGQYMNKEVISPIVFFARVKIRVGYIWLIVEKESFNQMLDGEESTNEGELYLEESTNPVGHGFTIREVTFLTN
jgi:hypothetical protein